VVDSGKRLRTVISSLEECQTLLAGSANRDAAQLVAMAILQLRMGLHHIADSELRALCDAMTVEQNDAQDVPGASSCGTT
jgi:hypothetical protein